MRIIGHQRIVKFLKRILSDNIPFQGFLFYGPAGVGKKTTAFEFAKGIVCERKIFGGCKKCKNCEEFEKLKGLHRDLFFVAPQKEKGYGIETSWEVKNFLASRPQLSSRQVVIMDEADELTPEAQNALLKILEEPPEDALLILITAKPGRIFETLRSRLVPISFRLVSEKEIAAQVKSLKAAKFAFGRPGRALRFREDPELLQEEEKLIDLLRSLPEKSLEERMAYSKELSERAKEVFPLWQLVLREKVFSEPKLLKILRRAFNAALVFEDTTVPPRLLFENLFLEFDN
jgi:DNA polymerase-3 subunit delta'